MKKILIGVGVIVVILVCLLIAGLYKLGPIIKTAVNTYGPEITKTDVHLDDAGVSLLKGKVRLDDFTLGNPKGFNSAYAMKVQSIFVDVDEGSLTRDTVIIDKIEIIGPEITYEKKMKTDNFKEILKNIQGGAPAGSRGSQPAAKEDGKGKKIMIRDFVLKGGRVNLATSLLGGQAASAEFPEIHLKDVGKENGGTTPKEAFSEIFAVLYKNISSPDMSQILNEKLQGLSGDVKEQMDKAGEDIKAATDAEVKKQVDSLDENLGKQLEGLLGN